MAGIFQYIGSKLGIGQQYAKFWASWAGVENFAGERVTLETIMGLAAMWRAIRLYSETVATLPINVFKYGPDGRGVLVRDGNNPYDAVLRLSPNADQTPTEFWEGLIGCLLLMGDGLAHKERVGDRITGLTQMDPSRADCLRGYDGVPGRQWRYVDYTGKSLIYPDADVFQVKGFNFGGDRGMSLVQYGSNSLGAALAADKVSGKIFRSGLSSSGFLQTQQTINENDRPRLEQVMQDYIGSNNAGKMMILEGGMEFKPISMPAADAQLLQSRQFNIEEIARWAGLPPILLGHASDGQTMWGTGVESIITSWYVLGLRAMLTRIEKAIQKRLFNPADQQLYYAKFAVEGLLRGDSAARAALYAVYAQNGIMTRDEIRDLEELAPYLLGGSNKLTAQVNLTTLDKIGVGPDAGTKGGPPAPTDPAAAQAVRNALSILGIEQGADMAEIRLAMLKISSNAAALEELRQQVRTIRASLPGPKSKA